MFQNFFFFSWQILEIVYYIDLCLVNIKYLKKLISHYGSYQRPVSEMQSDMIVDFLKFFFEPLIHHTSSHNIHTIQI
jgi:hypothetical protein